MFKKMFITKEFITKEFITKFITKRVYHEVYHERVSLTMNEIKTCDPATKLEKNLISFTKKYLSIISQRIDGWNKSYIQ